MRLITTVTVACGAAASLAAALPSQQLVQPEARLFLPPGSGGSNSTKPGLPATDPFYKPPSGYESKANGAILRSRQVTPQTSAASTAYQILYKTTDAIKRADATVTTVFVPKKPQSPAKIISLQLPQDSVSVNCAPSAALVKGSNSPGNLGFTFTTQGLEASLNKGYYVVIPDHEGSKAAAFVGPVEGHAVLDSLKAVTKFKTAIPDVQAKTPIVLGGYSGGAHAAAWGANLYNKYASSLNIVGQAIGGTPVNLTSVLLYINGGTFSGFAGAGVVGEYLAYPDLKEYIDANVYPNGTELLKSIQDNKCLTDVVLQYGNKDLFSYFKIANPLDNPIPKRTLAENLLGGDGNIVKVPTVMFHGSNDGIIPYNDAVNYAKQQCAGGGMFHFVTDQGGNHISTLLDKSNDFTNWLDQLHQGTADTSCNL